MIVTDERPTPAACRQDVSLRRATLGDAALLRTCFELASDGMAPYFWEQSRREGQALDDVALERMRVKIADPKNDIWIAAEHGGAIVSYNIPSDPEPLNDLPHFLRPLVELENRVPDTRYINALAVLPGYRCRGLGRALIGQARRDGGGRQLSLIVESENHAAQSLYGACGFRVLDSVPAVKGEWSCRSDRWILMTAA